MNVQLRWLLNLGARASRSLAVIFWSLLFFSSCATFDFKADQTRVLIRENKVDQALQELKDKAWKPSDDQLVYLFDYGMAAHIAHNYEESNRSLILADQVSEVKDYHSVSRITGSLLLNEGMVQYKGDDYEKVLINAVLAINFLMMNKHDDALVETRKLNQKLYNYRYEAKKNYEQNPFAHYLAAMIWESDRKWDDAYIDYKKTYELTPHFPYLQEDLVRLATKSGRSDDLKKWKKEFPNIKIKKEWSDKTAGEIILIYEQGWGPRKRPDPGSPRLPKLYPIGSNTTQARLSVGGVGVEMSQRIYSVEETAMKTLGDQYAALVAKRMAGIATKAVVADQLRQKNSALGDLAWIGMNLVDRADTRQWSTLPETFQIARIWVKAGKYQVKVEGVTALGANSGEELAPYEVVVESTQKVFITWRSVK